MATGRAGRCHSSQLAGALRRILLPLLELDWGDVCFISFFISHIPRASPEVSHYEDGMKQEMGDL